MKPILLAYSTCLYVVGMPKLCWLPFSFVGYFGGMLHKANRAGSHSRPLLIFMRMPYKASCAGCHFHSFVGLCLMKQNVLDPILI